MHDARLCRLPASAHLRARTGCQAGEQPLRLRGHPALMDQRLFAPPAQVGADLVLLSSEAVHGKRVDANLLAEFVSCPLLLLP
jgi:hypothetical protein